MILPIIRTINNPLSSDQQNRQYISKYGSSNRVSANNIISLIANDVQCTPAENGSSNNSISNKNNK